MNAVSTEPDIATAIEISVSGLLFDMDGVLLSSTQGDERCWRRWAAHHGFSDTFDLRRAHGRRVVDTIREHLPELTHDAITDHVSLFDRFAEEEQAGIVAYPGVVELLASLPSCSWTVVTSASKVMMRHRLATVGIRAPSQAVGGDTVRMGKPHPESYLRGAELLMLGPEQCLVIEDAPAGICAGKAAGCSVLAIASTHPATELQQADWIVASIDQIKMLHDASNATLKLRIPATHS